MWCVIDCDRSRRWWLTDLGRAERLADWLENNGHRCRLCRTRGEAPRRHGRSPRADRRLPGWRLKQFPPMVRILEERRGALS
jgi:hypothetical protein